MPADISIGSSRHQDHQTKKHHSSTRYPTATGNKPTRSTSGLQTGQVECSRVFLILAAAEMIKESIAANAAKFRIAVNPEEQLLVGLQTKQKADTTHVS